MIEVARALFAVPPFPRARGHAPVQPGATAGDGETAARLATAMRKARVGGTFWGHRPALPSGPLDLSAVGGLDPWYAFDKAEALQAAADDPIALLAAIAAVPVKVVGEGPFSRLDGLAPGSLAHDEETTALVQRHLLDGIDWRDPFTGAPSDPLKLVETLALWRDLIETNRPIAAAFGFAHWKRDTVDPLLWGGASVPFRPARSGELDALAPDAAVAVWKARTPAAFLAELEAGPWPIIEVEDGFIRSVGLGADCVPPLSIVLDDQGVHFDASRPNLLEATLARGDFAPDVLARAMELREWLVREGVSKYGVGQQRAAPRPGGERRHIVVIGQVEDDRSVLFGGGEVQTNLELLRRVRAREPDAWLVYRPHPDVEAGHRRGAIPARTVLDLANSIDKESPISALIAMADELHVITSLAGFEALMQGKPVTTHGTPFYAGWGLTHDLGAPCARRGVRRTIDELVAAVLLLYPRYLDPVTNLPCTAEILVMRLLSGAQRQNVALVPMRRFIGHIRRWTARIVGAG